mgnify:CR=1 FL=1
MFAVALALGLLAAAFILLLIACRQRVWRACCGTNGTGTGGSVVPTSEGTGIPHHLVVNLAGEQDVAGTAAAKEALHPGITVHSAGGGFVMYSGDKRGAVV